MTRRAWTLTTAAALGIALFAWTVVSVGPRELLAQLNALAPVLPLIVVLAAVRFYCQAAGWRLAMPAEQRPLWGEAFAAVVAGEAAGYFTWGPVSREPMKALLVEHRLPQRDGLAAAIVERTAYSVAATTLIVAAIAMMASRLHHLDWFFGGTAIVALAGAATRRFWRRPQTRWIPGRNATLGLGVFAVGQELTNVLEAYVVLSWLGASPAVAAIVALEGIGRLVNSAGQFIPGKLGVTEAATAGLADVLSLGAAHGLGLALARRVRSLVWGAVGIAYIAARAAQSRLQTV